MLAVPQTSDPLLQALFQAHAARPPDASVIVVAASAKRIAMTVAQLAMGVLHLQFLVLAIVSSNGDGVARVQRAIALSSMVILVQVSAILHLNAVVVDLVGLKRAIEGEAGLSLAVEVFWVVCLCHVSVTIRTIDKSR